MALDFLSFLGSAHTARRATAVAILVGKGRAQAVDALERASQMAIDLHGRRLPCFEGGNAMDLFALVFGNKVGVKIEYFGVILDKHRKSVGWQPSRRLQ
jgi:hypothetical protein